MLVFFAFLFFLLGLLSGIYSIYLLFLSLPLFLYLFFYKRLKQKTFLFLPFLLFGLLLILLYPKGNIEASSLTGIIVRQKENYYLLLTWQGKYYVSSKENNLTLFSLLQLEGKVAAITSSHYENSFRFDEYLKTQGVFYEFKVTSTKILFRSFYDMTGLENYLTSFLSDTTKDIVKSLLFGQSYANEDIQELGLFSLFSLGGFHLSFLFHIIELFLKKKQKKFGPYITLGLTTLFLLLSGFKFTMRRLFLLALVKVLSSNCKRRLSSLAQLSLVSLVMLTLEPYSLLSSSFYYAFPLLFFLRLFPSKKKGKMAFAISLFLFLLPYRFIDEGGFSFFTLLFQLVLIPYSHGLFLLSCLLIFVPQIGILLNILCDIFLNIVSLFSENNFFVVTGKASILFVIFYYLHFAFYFLLQYYPFKRLQKYILVSFVSINVLQCLPDYASHYEITMIDVDQGSSLLVRYQRQNILIDTGGKINVDLATECLIPYFRSRKINKLDAVLITHYDYDHYGALDSLRSHFTVDNVYDNTDFLSQENNSYTFGGLTIENLNDYNITADTNSTSAVFSFTIKDKRILVMGDAPTTIEKRLLNEGKDINSDILVVGHHGSKTSSSLAFLKEVSPSLALISCGENNSYGFPHQQVLQNLQALSIPYRRTDLEGSVTLRFQLFPWQ